MVNQAVGDRVGVRFQRKTARKKRQELPTPIGYIYPCMTDADERAEPIRSLMPLLIRKTPWHLWVIAILTLLWNGLGAYTIMMAQAGRLPDLGADEAAYYATQPLWFVIATDMALLSALAAAVALLLRRRMAAWLFALSLIAIVVNNVYEIAMRTSLVLVDRGWLIMTVTIAFIAVLQLAYAWAMKKRALLQ